MNCRDCVQLLAEYLDAALDPAAQTQCREHLERCGPCGEYFRSYQMSVEIGRGACRQEDPPDPQLSEQLVRALRDARQQP